jgi:hypothetical protein
VTPGRLRRALFGSAGDQRTVKPSATDGAERWTAPQAGPGSPDDPVAVDLRILLLAASADEPSARAWEALLRREGAPHDVVIAGTQSLTADRLEHRPGHGRYHAIVLSTDTLVRLREGSYVSGLSGDEWDLLRTYEMQYRVRQVSAYATPAPSVGLRSPSWAGDVGGATAVLTAPGRDVFPDLVGPVPLSSGTYGFAADIVDGADFTTLVETPEGSPIVGIVRHASGREELIFTVSTGPSSRHFHLLGHGVMQWAVRGWLGGRRSFFLSLQVDDVLLAASGGIDHPPIRMTPLDVRACVAWSESSRVRLDLAYNGWGSVSAIISGSSDPLTDELVRHAGSFNWLNHTFGHLNLDDVSEAVARDEIRRNLEWAARHGLPVQLGSVVTGAHSGLDNANVAAVLDELGIDWLASDASVEPDSRAIGIAATVPRHPINIPLDASTLDTLRRRGSGRGAGTPGESKACDQLAVEAGLMLDHLLSGDPRPHYTHQNALVDDRLLLRLLDDVLAQYKQLVTTPPRQISMAEAGLELIRRQRWSSLVDMGAVSAVLVGDAVRIANHSDSGVDIPMCGPGQPRTARWSYLRPGGTSVARGVPQAGSREEQVPSTLKTL